MISAIRQEIITAISSIIPFDVLEQEHLDFVKDWIASGAEIFRIAKPDKPNIHLVSYFIVLDPSTNELLLVDHKKAELWLPPGGHVELNEKFTIYQLNILYNTTWIKNSALAPPFI